LTVTVYLLQSPGALDVMQTGAAHPVLGGLIDLGTVAPLATRPDGTRPEDVRICCEELAPGVRVVERGGPLTAALRDELETLSAKEPLLVVLFLPDDGAALVVACGPELPSMGPVPACDVPQFRASLLVAMGQPQENSLFAEPQFAFDQDNEDRLSDRLRQLYGE
jgi:hypothetical protein